LSNYQFSYLRGNNKAKLESWGRYLDYRGQLSPEFLSADILWRNFHSIAGVNWNPGAIGIFASPGPVSTSPAPVSTSPAPVFAPVPQVETLISKGSVPPALVTAGFTNFVVKFSELALHGKVSKTVFSEFF
jgi:hypothetical protein